MKLVFILSSLVKLGRNSTSPQPDRCFSKATSIIGVCGNSFVCLYHALNENAVQIHSTSLAATGLDNVLPRKLWISYKAGTNLHILDLGANASTFMPSINGFAAFYVSKQPITGSRLCSALPTNWKKPPRALTPLG